MSNRPLAANFPIAHMQVRSAGKRLVLVPNKIL
jgi:hypothetical protein